VQVALTKIPGVISADVSLADNHATVQVAKGQVTVDQLTAAVETAGFKTDSPKPLAEEEITLSVAGMT
jgi:copper chaperone CopZ